MSAMRPSVVVIFGTDTLQDLRHGLFQAVTRSSGMRRSSSQAVSIRAAVRSRSFCVASEVRTRETKDATGPNRGAVATMYSKMLRANVPAAWSASPAGRTECSGSSTNAHGSS